MNLLKGSLLFLLLWEWLKPLSELGSFNQFSIFVIFLALLSAVEILNIRGFKGVLLKLGISLGVVYEMAKGLPKPPQHLWEAVQSDILLNYQRILEYHWWQTTAFGRSILFILLLWQFVEIVFRSVKKQVFGFLMCTWIYMILLDITTVLDMKGMVIRVSIMSLFLLSVQQLKKLELPINKPAWFATSSLIIALVVVVACSVPKPLESGPHLFQILPTGFPLSYKKVGYDSEDHRLGGSFTEDDTVAFQAVVNEKQYWRGESRSVYTGSSWQSAQNEQTTLPLGPRLGLEARNPAVKTTQNNVKVTFAQPNYSLLFYDGVPKEVGAISPKPLTLYTTGNQDIKVKYDHDQTVASYQLTEALPVLNEDVLRKSKATGSEAVNKEYLQLPSTLPARVKQLAQDITHGQVDAYDKAVAIENYLKNQGIYQYEKTDVPIPVPGQDFVDQFLFETKRGYCDHFSSSMVVLLRSVGIPARYVKGFSSGEAVPIGNDQLSVTVRNKDAHSWVEAYFNDYGWVTFDPTPGFLHPQEVESSVKNEETQPDVPVSVSPVVPEPPPNQPDQQNQDQLQANGQQGESLAWGKWVAFIFIAMTVGLWVKRRRVQLKILEYRVRKAQSPGSLFRVYFSLLAIIGARYVKRRKDETVQEFVYRVPLDVDIKPDLLKLTSHYEEFMYGNQIRDMEESKDLLQKLIRVFLS